MRRSTRRVFPVMALVLALVLALAPPLAADTYPRQPGIDVLEYVFRLQLADDTDEISGVTTVDLRLRQEGVAELALDLVADTGSGTVRQRTVRPSSSVGFDRP